MTTTLSLTSLITNNRITSTFTDEFLPKFARYGELYVVAGVLYIYADLDKTGKGKWFPLTNKKVERNTWNSQLAEAQAYLKDHSVETPMLQIISTLRGLTLDEMVNKVILKSNEYQTMVATLIAEKQILESKIQAANTNEELNNLLIDLNNY